MFKKILKLWPILIFLGVIIFFEVKGHLQRKKIYEHKINSSITKKENNWTGGHSYDYITKDGKLLTVVNSDTLKVGDSISKEKNTPNFKVFRKNKLNDFQYFKTINIGRE